MKNFETPEGIFFFNLKKFEIKFQEYKRNSFWIWKKWKKIDCVAASMFFGKCLLGRWFEKPPFVPTCTGLAWPHDGHFQYNCAAFFLFLNSVCLLARYFKYGCIWISHIFYGERYVQPLQLYFSMYFLFFFLN